MSYVLLGFLFVVCGYLGYLLVRFEAGLRQARIAMNQFNTQAQDIVDRTKPQLILADWETLDQLKRSYKEVQKACQELRDKELKVVQTLELPNGEEVGELPEKVRIMTAAIADLAEQFDEFKKFVTQIRGR